MDTLEPSSYTGTLPVKVFGHLTKISLVDKNIFLDKTNIFFCNIFLEMDNLTE